MEAEVLRERYRPSPVRVLFVGESPPAGGTFFYRGDSNLARYTCEAFLGRPCSPDDVAAFPVVFRDRGYYLVDLCAEPVNGLDRSERRCARQQGIDPLASLVGRIRPAAIVVVMKGIQQPVRTAVTAAGLSHLPFFVLPFPSYGHQRRYVNQLRALLPTLDSLE